MPQGSNSLKRKQKKFHQHSQLWAFHLPNQLLEENHGDKIFRNTRKASAATAPSNPAEWLEVLAFQFSFVDSSAPHSPNTSIGKLLILSFSNTIKGSISNRFFRFSHSHCRCFVRIVWLLTALLLQSYDTNGWTAMQRKRAVPLKWIHVKNQSHGENYHWGLKVFKAWWDSWRPSK